MKMSKSKTIKKLLTVVFCIMLTAASAMFYSCENKDKDEGNVLGTGSTSFKLEVIDNKGEIKIYTIKTDEKTLGDALIHDDVKLVPSTDKDSGMISSVDGITADWNIDQSYWSFYINGEYATVGAFAAEIEKDATYRLEYVKEEQIAESAE